jgi:L-threonylcarbamoyladenylate synthase
VTRRFDVADASARALGVKAAATIARRGRVVLAPTESVYALLVDAFSTTGVASVRRLKDRPDSAALPVAVSSLTMLRGIAERLPSAGQQLVEAFWPGPLTIVCQAQPSLAWAAGGTRRSLTVRMPLHPLALEVIAAVGPCVLIGVDPPLTLDPTGAPTPGIDIVLDAGAITEPAGPSSVVDVRGAAPVLVRAGALGLDRLAGVVPDIRPAGE